MANCPERQRPETDGSVGLLQTLETSLDSIRTLIVCRVCIRPLFEPYTIECGHTFCYGCLSRWFERDRTKKSCPDCRAEVLRAPAPAYLVRDMTQIFINGSELLPVGETTEEHKRWQGEEAALVEKDRLATGPTGGLFRGCFRSRSRSRRRGMVPRSPIRDLQDGVDRCPRCTFELQDGICESCGYPSEGDELSDSDAPEYYPPYGEADDLSPLDYEGPLHYYDSEYSPAPFSEEGYSSDGSAMAPLIDENGRLVPGPRSRSLSAQDDTEEDSEYVDSMDEFVEEDEAGRQDSPSSPMRSVQSETDPASEVDEDMQSQHSENAYDSEAEVWATDGDGDVSTYPDPDNQWHTEEESDEDPIPPSRRQTFQRLLDRVSTIGSEDEDQPLPPGRRTRLQNNGQRRSTAPTWTPRNIPHHSRMARTNPEGSHGVRIEFDSESEGPISASQATRRRRNQRIHLPDAESAGENSSETATVGRLSPRMVPTRRNGGHPGGNDHSESSPILIESSPKRSATGPNHEDGDLPRNLEDQNHLASPSANDQRPHSTQRLSPLPPRSHRNSPVPGPCQASTPEEQQAQGLRDRQNRKTERKAERRRLKAERDQRHVRQVTGSTSPLRPLAGT